MLGGLFLCMLFLASSLVASSCCWAGSLHLGSDDRVRVPDVIGVGHAATVECWLKPDAGKELCSPVSLGLDSNGYGFFMHNGIDSESGPYLSIRLAGITMSATANSARLPIGIWTHLAMTRDSNTWKLYKNGELVGEGRAKDIEFAMNLWLGGFYNGFISDLRIWDRVLDGSEIRSRLPIHLLGSEVGLTLYYPFDDSIGTPVPVIHNHAATTATLFSTSFLSTPSLYLSAETPISQSSPTQFTSRSIPAHMRFFARSSDNFATVHFSIAGAFDSVLVQRTRNDSLIDSAFVHSGNGIFSYDAEIHAEPSQYTFEVYGLRAGSRYFVGESADLVCGDVYLIMGQSNAHPADNASTYLDPMLRTFGIQTPNENYDSYQSADTSWGLANAHGFGAFLSGPYLTGIWGLQIQALILQTYHIPVCIINGATGGSTIEANLRTDRMDLSTIYGKSYYRVHHAGLDHQVKAIVWYQGESNTVTNYYDKFVKLRETWYEDYPSLQKIYLVQVRPGCTARDEAPLRELQRTLSDSLKNITVMSTVAIPDHYDCHYAVSGYLQFAADLFPLIARDFYGGADSIPVRSPNVDRIFYTTSLHDQIAVTLRDGQSVVLPPDSLIAGRIRSMKEYLTLDSGIAIVSGISVRGDTLLLQVPANTLASSLSYVPDVYPDSTTYTYQGPWLLNDRGLGLLSFWHVPIVENPSDTSPIHTTQVPGVAIYPNPTLSALSLRLTGWKESPARIKIYDVLGRTAYDSHVTVINANSVLTLSPSLAAGSYSMIVSGVSTRLSVKFNVLGHN